MREQLTDAAARLNSDKRSVHAGGGVAEMRREAAASMSLHRVRGSEELSTEGR